MSVLLFLQGSQSGDLSTFPGENPPFDPCPGSPNCIIHSAAFRTDADILFRETHMALESMNPQKLTPDSQSLQISSVFRIRIFGFKDDLQAVITHNDGFSVLHIKSVSRVGHSDLGVNRRRVKRLLRKLRHLSPIQP
jgi:uncharacterized protein (DUF1499 family)